MNCADVGLRMTEQAHRRHDQPRANQTHEAGSVTRHHQEIEAVTLTADKSAS
jgi:hypothetical protein